MNLWQRLRAALTRSGQPGEQRIYVSPRQGGLWVNEDSALTVSAVWACVRVISETLASLPWAVYQRDGDARKALPQHGVHWLLNVQPNPEMTAFAFREAMLAHALTWGNAYAEIERGLDGRPVWLWPITPDRVTPKRTANGELVYEARNSEGDVRVIPAAGMYHLHGLGFDGLTGYSPVSMAARAIGLGMAQDSFGQSFYANGLAFGGMVEVPANMSKEQITHMEAYLNEQHKGPDKAFRVRIAANGMKYHPISMPMTDAQFLESRKFTVTDVARWYRVPPHKIADLDRSTNNNIEHQSIEFVTDTLVPWAVRMEQEANVKLFGKRAVGSVYTKVAVNALMRGDAKSRGEFYRLMTQIGALSINEVRALEELNGIGDAGDERLVQTNQTTLERLVADPVEAPPALPKPAPEDDAEDTPSAANGNVVRMEALKFWREHKQELQA